MRAHRQFAGRSVLLCAIAVMLTACVGNSTDPLDAPATAEEESAVTLRPIEAVMNDHVQQWMQIPGVTTVYVSQTDRGQPCIKIGVVERDAARDRQFPAQVEGYPIVVEATGEIRPLGP